MTNLTEKDKSLASLALFSDLYDTHRNIVDVIQEFIRMSIMGHGELFLSPAQIYGYLKEDYGFAIPMAVVQATIRKTDFLIKDTKVKGMYNVKTSSFHEKSDAFKGQVDAIKSQLNKVIKSLRQHLREQCFENIDKINDSNLRKALNTYLIESIHTSKISSLIEQFVIMHPEFRDVLQKITDGSIIFTGLSYNSGTQEFSTVKDPLTIYLDTEILFYGAGYDGTTLKIIFDEFIETVNQVNNINYAKNGKKLILLKYFPEVRKEVETYFGAAERIKDGKSPLDASRSAMGYIVQKAKNRSDLVRLKAQFWKFLKDNNIEEETYGDYYAEHNKSYNIESKEFLMQLKLTTFHDDEDAQDNLRFLNYINIRRGGKIQDKFSSIGYIFVTQTQLAFTLDNLVRRKMGRDNYPMAQNISDITARLWLGLNKGFNPSTELKSIDVIVKAQVGLSNRVACSLEKRHRDLINEHADSSVDTIVTELTALRQYVPHKPEELTASSDLVINANDIDRFVDDKVLEIQQKDDKLREKDQVIKDLEESHKNEISHRQEENTVLKATLRSIAQKKFAKDLKEWKCKAKKKARRLCCQTITKSIGVIIWPIIIAIISIWLFYEDHKEATLILIVAAALIEVAPIFQGWKSAFAYFTNIGMLFSKKRRVKYLYDAIILYEESDPRPTLQKTLDSILKNDVTTLY